MGEKTVNESFDTELTVSCMNCNTELSYLRRHYGDISSIFDGFEVTEEYLSDPNNWISIGTAQRLRYRIKDFTGNRDPRLFFEIGRETDRLQSLGALERIARLYPNPRIVVERIPHYNKKFNNLYEMEVYDVESRSAKLNVKYRSDFREDFKYDVCPLIFGTIATIPHIWGLPDMEIIEKQCIFNLDEIVNDSYGYLGLKTRFENGRLYVDDEEYAHEVFNEDGNESLGYVATKDLDVGDTHILTEGVIYGGPCCSAELRWENKSIVRNLYDLTIGRAKQWLASREALEEQLDYSRQQFFEIQRLNRELRQYATSLEQKVEQRTAQLVQETNLGLLGRLSAQVAHELRTPQDATRNELELIRGYLPDLVFLHRDIEKLGLEEPIKTEFYGLARQAFEQGGKVEYRTRSTIEALAKDLYEDLKAKYGNITLTACKDIGAMGCETDTSRLDRYLQVSDPGQATGILRKVFNAGYSIHNALGSVTKEMSITNALLEHAHGDTKQIEAVDVKEKLSTTLTLYDRVIKDSGIKLETHYGENLGAVECNAVRLNLAYRNVIQNAIDALNRKEGERILRIKTGSEDGYAVVEISDNGPGIPTEDIDKLAHPTFTTKPIGEGTGLGLSIVHNILQEHNGYLQCSSQPGETTFRLKIPFKYHGRL
jgi:signal transduction histidine kinase